MIRSRIRRDGWIDEFGKWHRHPTCPRQGGGLSHFHAVKFRWSIAPPPPLLARRLTDELRVSPLLARCLVNRGLTEQDRAADFLQPRLRQLSDPFLLPNMAAAVERLFLARRKDEPLVIFGDYDVDGVTSTALLTEILTALGWRVNHYLPHRLDEGYGLSQDGVENCLRRFPIKLLLAVDCGSTAVPTVDWLGQRGVDVIVLDHHQVSNGAAAQCGRAAGTRCWSAEFTARAEPGGSRAVGARSGSAQPRTPADRTRHR